MNPYIIINFKTYKQATGKNAFKLAKKLESVAKKNKHVMLAVQASEICCLKYSKLPILAQHVDPFEPGRNTGFILPETVKKDGAVGTLLNHAEHRISFLVLKKTIVRCKKLKLKTIVCIPNLRNIKKIISLNPDFLAFEDPKLISTGKSICDVRPDALRKFALALKKTKIIPLCGAGISSPEDVKKALEFGTKGVLVASAVVKSKNPDKILKSLLSI